MQYKIKRYLIIMADYDDFILLIKQDINRPNNPNDDELIEQYMNDNYNSCKYRTIDLDFMDYFHTIEI